MDLLDTLEEDKITFHLIHFHLMYSPHLMILSLKQVQENEWTSPPPLQFDLCLLLLPFLLLNRRYFK